MADTRGWDETQRVLGAITGNESVVLDENAATWKVLLSDLKLWIPTIYPVNEVVFGDGSTPGGITDPNCTWDPSSRDFIAGDPNGDINGVFIEVSNSNNRIRLNGGSNGFDYDFANNYYNHTFGTGNLIIDGVSGQYSLVISDASVGATFNVNFDSSNSAYVFYTLTNVGTAQYIIDTRGSSYQEFTVYSEDITQTQIKDVWQLAGGSVGVIYDFANQIFTSSVGSVIETLYGITNTYSLDMSNAGQDAQYSINLANQNSAQINFYLTGSAVDSSVLWDLSGVNNDAIYTFNLSNAPNNSTVLFDQTNSSNTSTFQIDHRSAAVQLIQFNTDEITFIQDINTWGAQCVAPAQIRLNGVNSTTDFTAIPGLLVDAANDIGFLTSGVNLSGFYVYGVNSVAGNTFGSTGIVIDEFNGTIISTIGTSFITLDGSAFVLSANINSSNILLADHLNFNYKYGDIDGANNQTFLEIDDANNEFSFVNIKATSKKTFATVSTTDATPTVLFTIPIAATEAIAFRMSVKGICTGGIAGTIGDLFIVSDFAIAAMGSGMSGTNTGSAATTYNASVAAILSVNIAGGNCEILITAQPAVDADWIAEIDYCKI